jgi:hypothetical protein
MKTYRDTQEGNVHLRTDHSVGLLVEPQSSGEIRHAKDKQDCDCQLTLLATMQCGTHCYLGWSQSYLLGRDQFRP